MGWNTVQLGDVCPSKTNKNHSYAADDVVWHLNLDQVEANSGKVLNKVLAPVSDAGNSTHWFDERHVLYSKLRPYLNKVVLPDEPGVATTELVPLLPDINRLDRNYLAHYLRSNIFVNWISNQVAGAKMPRVSMNVFWEHEIPLPPLKEQKRIAAILDKADSLRRKRQQAIELADEFLRAVFLDMFGDPIMNSKGWPSSKWSDVLKIINGKNQKNVVEENGEYPIYGSGGEMGRANDYLCHENTVVIGRKGNINKPLLVTEKFWNVDTAFGLEADLKKLTYQYLYWFCKFFNFEKLNKTVTIPSLTKSDLLEIVIPLPKMELQAEFVSISTSIDRLLKKFDVSESEGDDLSVSLTQKAFSGEL